MKKSSFLWTLFLPYIEALRVFTMLWCNKNYELFGNLYPGILLIIAMAVCVMVISTVIMLLTGFIKKVALDEIDETCIRQSLVLKVAQVPAIILLVLLTILCLNPSLVILALLLMCEIGITIVISSMMGLLYIIHITKKQEIKKSTGILYGVLILVPVAGLVIAFMLFKKIEQNK